MNPKLSQKYDVLVIGGGCAALSAAITARENDASVLILETAPKNMRAGNSRHTRNMRLAHETKVPPYTGAYPEEEMWENYLKATGGAGDLALAKKVVSESSSVLEWMMQHNVRFQPAISGTLHLGRTNAWFLGGGKAMMNSLYRSAETIGVDICYEAEVVDLDIRDRFFHGATVLLGGAERVKVSASTVIAAAGGFQSNLKWMREVWVLPRTIFLSGEPHLIRVRC